MAFYTRKRTASYAMSRPFKRARVVGRRRFSVRRRFSRRKNTVNSQRGNWNSNGYSRKRMNKRKYNRILWEGSLVAQHYRSLLSTVSSGTATPANITQASVNAVRMIGAAFWTTGGGLSAADFTATPTFNDSDLMIRGGKSTLSIINTSSVMLRIRSWKAKTTLNGVFSEIINSITSAAWDPSHQTQDGTIDNIDFHKNFRFYDVQEQLLEPGDACSREHYFKPHKVDQDEFTAAHTVDFWIYSISNMQDSTSVTSVQTVSHNISFTGDNGA